MAREVATLSKAQRKNILLNPVAVFKELSSLSNDEIANENTLITLRQLQQQFADISQQLKDAQDKGKRISRKIGEAKRNKQPCDDLLQDMKELSGENKNLKNQLDIISAQILDYFEADTDNTNKTTADSNKNKNKTSGNLPPVRTHATRSSDTEPLSIDLLEKHQESDISELWNHYVDSNIGSSLYHRIEWKQLIEDVFGHKCYYFYARNDKKIVGILPLVRLNSRLFGNFWVSMPYFNSGGAIADSLQIEQRLMQTANSFAEKTDSSHIEYRDDISRDDMPVRDEKVNMILALPDSEEALWQSFSSKLRSQIRRPQREDTSIKTGGIDCLNDFYTVFAQNMRDLGTPVYSKSFFREILSTFPENSKIIIVRLKGRPVAAAFLLGHNETLEIPWASTIKSVNSLSMNMLLYWEVLKFAIDSKCRYFDFGRSSKDSGTFRFKQQWGAKPKQCYWHYWLADNNDLPELNPNNPKYKLVIATWKKIPVWLSKIIGPGIVKNLP